MEWFILWIILTMVVTAIGDKRKIGSLGAFFISLFLSPLIGFLVVLSSKRKDTEEFEKALLAKASTDKKNDYIDSLFKLQGLLDAGAIDKDTYDKEREKLEANKDKEIIFYDSKDRGYSLLAKGMDRFVKIPRTSDGSLKVVTKSGLFEVVISPSSVFAKDNKFVVNINKYPDRKVDIATLI